MKYVTSLETSKKLMEAGVDKPSKFVWTKFNNGWFVEEFEDICYRWDYHAYLLSELLEMVEGDWCMQFDEFANRVKNIYHFDLLEFNCDLFSATTPIQAVAEAILWQKENQQ